MAGISLVVDPAVSSLVYANDPCIFATEADALLAQIPDPVEWDLLPATLDQALADDIIDDEMLYLLLAEQQVPFLGPCLKPFVPTAAQRLEGRAQLVADTYTFLPAPDEIIVINPDRPQEPYYITHPAADCWLCTCPAFTYHPDAGVCKHLLAAMSIKGFSLDYPEPDPPAAPVPAVPASMVRPVEILPDAATLAKMGWDGTADSW